MALTPLEKFALMVAAVAHDMDHPGGLASCFCARCVRCATHAVPLLAPIVSASSTQSASLQPVVLPPPPLHDRPCPAVPYRCFLLCPTACRREQCIPGELQGSAGGNLQRLLGWVGGLSCACCWVGVTVLG